MKKVILIILGAFIILSVVGVWVYLFTYGTPKNSGEVFARFGIGDNTDTEVIPTQVNESETVDMQKSTDAGAPQKLRQLTTRPVAGAVFAGSELIYVEQGTGHIYAINLDGGKETLVNGTTIAQSAEAVFSTDGAYVAITSYGSSGNTVVVERVLMDSEEIEGVTLPAGATDVAFSKASNTVLYLLKNSNGSSGYSYNILKKSSTLLFSIPLSDIRVLWGTPTYVYTTPTATAVGFIYKIEGNSLAYVTGGGYGLMGLPYSGGIVITSAGEEMLYSITNRGKDNQIVFTDPLIPEKCVADQTLFYCAIPTNKPDPQTFPDEWYKGVVSYSDTLWLIDTKDGSASTITDFLAESGREVDVSKIGIDDAGKRIYFVNKNDNTLWMFDMTI
jgi:hypothetical protein